jgi:putative flippase GtrA
VILATTGRRAAAARAQHGGRLIRYTAVSAISLGLSEALLISFNGGLGWGAAASSTVATGLATIPAYFLTRQWVWSQSGRSHLGKEVAPFWGIAIVSWAFATIAVSFAEDRTRQAHLRGALSVTTVALVYVLAYGVSWAGRYMLFNRIFHAEEQTLKRP